MGGAASGKYSQIREWEETVVWVFILLIPPDGSLIGYISLAKATGAVKLPSPYSFSLCVSLSLKLTLQD